ncbi:protein CHROMATIN REMODELING 25-like [Vicia villosa]|uniref:protein CHROMATIN REMODELING 25-like n=1 Tax=Vicia villosa TaxID=3911 RepID=UPI00273C7AC4|nr:protein CHROMATIN REMODELING 25-like [Vicia villosa]
MEDEEEVLSSPSSSDSDPDFDTDSGDAENEVEQRKSQNVEALIQGNLIVRRQSLLPRVLSVGTNGAAVCRKPFKPPSNAAYTNNQDLSRRLSARKRFVPWGSTTPIPIPNPTHSPLLELNLNVPAPEEEVKPSPLPPGIEPLVLWQPPHEDPPDPDSNFTAISVDTLLVRFLRPHQREGVQFMFDCVAGLCDTPDINGCILADDMGLGKTLQSITLLYTLICQGFDGKPMVRKAIIVTPTSLVSNWEAEIKKWVGERIRLVALCESTREDVISGINSFTSPRSNLQVLIISYETFRMHSSKFSDSGSCDLLICDEAHRLKNDQTITNRALAALPCKRRVLLSGTPLQNDLEEFFAMVNFTNPGVLGHIAHFRRYFEAPIICGREPAATAEEKKLGAERTAELSAKVNQFILRRTNALLSNHLPPKIVEVVCCKLTPLQSDLYKHFIQSKNVKRVINEEVKQSKILAYITALKKLCNHPKLIYDTIRSGSPGTSGFENCIRFFPPNMSSGRSGGHGGWVELSGKMQVLARLLAQLRQRTDDRIVLVSNYTQTLDLFAQLCREQRYPHLRLDGATSISKRQKLVNCLNDPSKDEFVFLLSSKAGGCGLNLIGANRLVLFDPDWNPANDKQAAARVWRDGQKKRVYIYRFLSTGTIEEKVYQRQMSKEGLQKVIQREQNDSATAQGNLLSTEDLRNLFTFDENVKSEIHENMRCSRCQTYDGPQDTDVLSTMINCEGDDEETSDIGGFAEISGCLGNLKRSEKQVGNPLEEDLSSWGHHFSPASVPDGILQASAGDEVTFVFTNQVDGKLVPVDSMSPKVQKKELHRPRRNVERKSTLFSSHNKLVPLHSASHSSSIAWKKEATSCEITKKVGIDVASNTKNSLVNEISKQKRSCPADINDEHSLLNEVSQKKICHVVISDDDFE